MILIIFSIGCAKSQHFTPSGAFSLEIANESISEEKFTEIQETMEYVNIYLALENRCIRFSYDQQTDKLQIKDSIPLEKATPAFLARQYAANIKQPAGDVVDFIRFEQSADFSSLVPWNDDAMDIQDVQERKKWVDRHNMKGSVFMTYECDLSSQIGITIVSMGGYLMATALFEMLSRERERAAESDPFCEPCADTEIVHAVFTAIDQQICREIDRIRSSADYEGSISDLNRTEFIRKLGITIPE